ncbi:sensor histidine kinase [Bailinhaonella thermotolerans]|uniref:Sensor histidine kinase n=1 Tax=Bailinhaonella thermotolerans TaxID=1070861 RepID=A0A3A4A8R4_9ACTN|nr:sensor histidine kinase [Bailinhaonella thermotolerans]RJL24471.1 sensor histidine kinase [Bailinhaonella thermotolerans]
MSDPGTGLIHQALFYDRDEEFLAATAGFCLDGLKAGDTVLAVTTAANIGLLRDHLGAAAGEVEFVDARDWYEAPGRTLAAYGRYVDEHEADGRLVRIIGEPVWHGRDGLEEAEWTRYESVINAAFAGSAAWIICPYDERALPAHVVANARRTHPELLAGGETLESAKYEDPYAFVCEGDGLPLPPPPDGAGESLLELRLPDCDLAEVRRRAGDHTRALGLPPDRVQRLVTALNELATNVLRHGGGQGRVLIWPEGGRIVCDVSDRGRLLTPFPGYIPPDPAAPNGHGLWVVRQLCDLLQVRATPEGSRFRIHLARA